MVFLTISIIILVIVLIIKGVLKISKNSLLSKNDKLLWYLIIFTLPIIGSLIVLFFVESKNNKTY